MCESRKETIDAMENKLKKLKRDKNELSTRVQGLEAQVEDLEDALEDATGTEMLAATDVCAATRHADV